MPLYDTAHNIPPTAHVNLRYCSATICSEREHYSSSAYGTCALAQLASNVTLYKQRWVAVLRKIVCGNHHLIAMASFLLSFHDLSGL